MMVDDQNDAQTRAEARAWFLRLLLEDEAKDVAEWEDWLAGGSARRQAYDQVVRAWEMSRHADATSAGQTAIVENPRIAEAPTRHPYLAGAMAMAASLAAIAGVGWLVYRSDLEPRPAASPIVATRSFSTEKGHHQTATLNDGSQLALGSATQVAVDLTPTSRNVSLKSGQIFVTVAKDQKRAFVVQTPFSSVTAVGTAFDVDLLEAGFTLSVLHGTVMVRATNPKNDTAVRSTLVRAGQRVAVTREGLTPLAWVVTSNAGPTWITGRLEYRDVPLRDVVHDVNRYLTDGIVLIEPSAGDLRYTGSIDVARIRPWLAGVAQAFDLQTRRDAGVVRIQKKLAS